MANQTPGSCRALTLSQHQENVIVVINGATYATKTWTTQIFGQTKISQAFLKNEPNQNLLYFPEKKKKTASREST